MDKITDTAGSMEMKILWLQKVNLPFTTLEMKWISLYEWKLSEK